MLSNDAGQALSESFHHHNHHQDNYHHHSQHQQHHQQQQHQQQHHQHQHHQQHHQHHEQQQPEDSSARFAGTEAAALDQQVAICSSNSASLQQHNQQLLLQQQQPGAGQNSAASSPGTGLFVKSEAGSERRYRPQKYCAVCGDRAIACNFNAVTCESCKAFFRRNAFKEQRLKCLFNNRCVINRVTRRFCSKCRILKCFQIGMKREWILTDEQKQMKRVKILQNKQLKKHSVSSSLGPYGSPLAEVDEAPEAHDNALDGDALQLVQLDRSRRMSGSIGSRSDSSVETVLVANTRSSSSTGGAHIEMKDAETSCPDEFELALGGPPESKLMHYCSLVPQCQYCFFKLAGSQCDIDEHTSGIQQQSSTTPDSLVGGAYQQSAGGQAAGGGPRPGSLADCAVAYPVGCGGGAPEPGSRSAQLVVDTSHQSDQQQNTSPGGAEEQRANSNCCYLEPVAASVNCQQQPSQFQQFVSPQPPSTATNTAEQHNSQMMAPPPQLSYLVPNCSAIVDSQHQSKVEFCPQACPIQPCVCRKNS